ncbi:type 1 glutamine amidotransferase [candidate division KSB1 bacterium]|nr:type 1 glutamine amidotransferase [candidate division KSB1 bacterium]
MNLHYFQHVPFEGPGSIESWALEYKLNISKTRFYYGDPPPDLNKIDCLVVLGGPMNVNHDDKYPWLVQEKDIVKEAIEKNKVVIGICLGAQIIADVLGAKITPNKQKEIGWFNIIKNPAAQSVKIADFLPDETLVFHWHSDTFDIPDNAIPLAQSEACQNQGFVYNDNVIAMQFHLESTRESIELLIENSKDDLVDGPFVQEPEKMLKCEQRIVEINFIMEKCLSALL